MNRCNHRLDPRGGRCSRACGDEPAQPALVLALYEVLPRARG